MAQEDEPADDSDETFDFAMSSGYAVYEVAGEGAWEAALEGQSLTIAWTEPLLVVDAHGTWVPAHGLVSIGPSYDGAAWTPLDIEFRTYSFEERHWLHRMTDAVGGSASSGTALLGLMETHRFSVDASVRLDFLPDGRNDCFLAPAAWSDMDCELPLLPNANWVHENPRETVLEDGRKAVAVDARSPLALMQTWYASGSPYAERIVVDAVTPEGAASLELRLATYEPFEDWELDPESLAMEVGPAFDPLRISRAEKFNNVLYSFEEDNVTHPFPLTDAIKVLWDDGIRGESPSNSNNDDIGYVDHDGPDRCGEDPRAHTPANSFLRGNLQPFVFHAEYAHVTGDYEAHHWLIGMTDGRQQEWIEFVRYPAGRPPSLAIDQEERCGRWSDEVALQDGVFWTLFGPGNDDLYAYYVDSPMADKSVPPITSARTSLPRLEDLVARWEALAEENVTANTYGFHIGCGSCDRLHWDMWVGRTDITATVTGPSVLPTTEVTHEATSSILRMDETGRLIAIDEAASIDSFAVLLGEVPGDPAAAGALPFMRPLAATRSIDMQPGAADPFALQVAFVGAAVAAVAVALFAYRRR